MSRVLISDQGTQPNQPRRDVCIVTDGSGKHRLCVDSTISVGSIDIGAVEIKDHDTGTMVDVEVVYDYHAIITYDAINFQKAKINVHGSAFITTGSTMTVASYTVPVGKMFTFTGVIVGGTGAAKFDLIINGSTTAIIRNSGSEHMKSITFIEPIESIATVLIEIKATNLERTSRTFEVTLSGYNLNV